MTGVGTIGGHFIPSHTGLSTKAEIRIKLTDESPICMVPWHHKIVLSSRFLNRPFRIAHPALKGHSFIIESFSLKEALRTVKVPLLYKMLRIAGLNSIKGA